MPDLGDRQAKLEHVQNVANQLVNEVEQCLLDNGLPAEYVDSRLYGALGITPHVVVSFELTGDWKYVHQTADDLVNNTFGLWNCKEVDAFSEDDSDYYTSTHQYTFDLSARI